ncbi:hypothetical protein [Lyngbya sp. CCY1209]|uniref:hypothetical protein n=1 Tax=Lyngbya sp. CCY1209 TaxID=2886103 RepID=UPI002D1FD83A|nr:hypothetical protein [Lyngbya sp. CCY1209]MEB3885791.1 hypothetical protein [Lyngbya sp. CCY1209]
MDLDRQIQTLIDNAPQDGSTPGAIAAIAPGLKLLAQELTHPEYFILQTLDGDWVMTTLGNVDDPDLEKRVIYAFCARSDASLKSTAPLSAGIVATPVPVTHILFQAIAIPSFESFIFFDRPGHLEAGTELKRRDVQETIQVYLRHYQSRRQPKTRPVPPDIA